MTCKDCIHCELCTSMSLEYTDAYLQAISKTGNVKDHCTDFKSTADFVEVVRCKDCKFNVANMEKDALDITDYSGEDIVCSYFMTDGMNKNDFCSYGERKGESDG